MSFKIHFLQSYQDFFPPSCGAVSGEHGGRFYQDISVMEQRYQGRWNEAMLSDIFCWPVSYQCSRPSSTFDLEVAGMST